MMNNTEMANLFTNIKLHVLTMYHSIKL